MQMNQMVPAGQLASKYGCKSLVFSQPGVGKTPAINSAPRPCLLAVEPGMLSMRGSTVPTWEAHTWPRIKEFFDWLKGSNETKNFDTVGTDSFSQICEIYLREHNTKGKHGMQLYGEMASACYDFAHQMFFMKDMHTYIICKQTVEDVDGMKVRRPYFPGNELNVKVPHLYDLIMHMGVFHVPGAPQNPNRAFHCHSATDAVCRDRSGMCAEFEPVNLTAIFAKCMSNNQG